MDLPEWLPTVLSVAAAICGGLWISRAFSASVNDRLLAGVLRKLFEERDVERANKLLAAAGAAPLCLATKAAIRACAEADTVARVGGGYRGSQDPGAQDLLAPVRARYDEAFEEAMRPIRAARRLALPSPILLVLGAAAAFARGPEQGYGMLTVAVLGLLVLAWAASKEIDIAAGRGRLFAALAPYFEALAREGDRGRPAKALEEPGEQALEAGKQALETEVREPERAPRVASSREEPGEQALEIEVREPGREPRVVSSPKPVIRIGCMASADVVLDVPGVLRMHAVIEVAKDQVTLHDLGADQATRVNGEPITRRVLADGDVITIGEAELRIRLRA